ncbi:hypothetical protein AV530_019548 [Patagioenas fasciata monilis]|uniref:Uncharacterized protein n=1 Tax=Patagioenas fasciata monilis TaxID=372326 RepID=A0A1V4JF41_PATFA|nr:hypothetical protein AV530_019548 [Patagioenas fasciata monilis]
MIVRHTSMASACGYNEEGLSLLNLSLWRCQSRPWIKYAGCPDAGSGQPALGSRSEGQRDVMTLKSCCWGKWYQPCTQPAELDRSCGPFCKFLCLSTMT